MMTEEKFHGTTRRQRRKDRRFPACMPATFQGGEAMVTEISFGGCAFLAENVDLEEGDVVMITISPEAFAAFQLEATILRRTARSHYAVAFSQLTTTAFQMIERLQTGRNRRQRHNLNTSSAAA